MALSQPARTKLRESRIRILVLCANYTDQLSYYDDWVDALVAYPEFDTRVFNIIGRDAVEHVAAELHQHDAVVLLHSTNGDTTIHLERLAGVLADRRYLLVSFVGNEVNLPGTPIAAKRRVLGKIAPDWIATQLLQEAGEFLFGDIPKKGVVSFPHALNTRVFRPTIPLNERPIDIGSRVSRYVLHLGDDDRNRIAGLFLQLGRAGNLVVDISNSRLNRTGWSEFLNQCKGTVSSEAGSWYIERDDATVEAIRNYLRRCSKGLEIANDSRLLRLGYLAPPTLRRIVSRAFLSLGGRYEYDTVVEPQCALEIQNLFFAANPRPPVYGKCISSRHFDAAGTKTCQIMFRGRFNDILQADVHYLALEHDLSNMDEVLRRFNDKVERQIIVERTHEYVVNSHTYAHRMQKLSELLRGAA